MIILSSLIVAMASFMMFILIYAVKQYNRHKIIKRIERQLITSEVKKFSLLKILGLEKILERTQSVLSGIGIKIDAEDAFLIFTLFEVFLFIILTSFNLIYLNFLIPLLIVIIVPYIAETIAQKRYMKFNNQFADALQDISDYLKVNGNISTSIERVLPTLENPLKAYFLNIVEKVNSGISIYVALQDFAKEVNSPLVDSWVDSMIFAGQMKSNVADVCEKISVKIKKRLKQNRQIKALMMQTKSIMYSILGIMSIIMFALFTSSPEYLQSIKTTLGKIVLTYMIVSYLFTTFYVIKKINRMIGSV
jgi:tight adherence protein B